MEEHHLSILYADDEISLLDITKLYLERFGKNTVDIVPSAEEALEKLTSGSYDAIISDYQMPGMDGIQLLQEVRRKFGDIPFILFTGRGREEVVIQAINHGADFYLQKGGEPASQFAELEHKVRQAVSRRQAEHDLVKSERTSRALLDAMTDAVALITVDLTVIAANEVFFRRFDKQPAEMIGKNLHDFITPELGQERVARIKEAIRTKKIVRLEDKRGELFLENIYYPIFDEQGEVSRLAIYSRDITERKRAEDELRAAYEHIAADEEELREKFTELALSEKQVRESEEGFRSLAENSLDTIMLLDQNLLYLYVNPNVEKQTGIPAAQFIGKSPSELGFPPNLVNLWVDTIWGVFTSGNTIQIEYKLPSDIWMDWLVVPIRGGVGGGVEKVITSARDITSRKKIEEALKREQAFTKLLLDTSPAYFVAIGADGKILLMNQILLDTLGYTEDEVKGKDYLTSFVPEGEQEMLSNIFQNIVYNGAVTINKNQIISKSGREYLVEWHGRPVKGVGEEPDFFVGVGIDITRHKKTEESIDNRE